MNDISGNIQIGGVQQSYGHIEAPMMLHNQNANISMGHSQASGVPPDPQPNNQFVPKQEDFNISNATHPIGCFFHLLFKTLAILAYILPVQALTGQTTLFVIVVLLGCFDFWTVKNVTGR